MAFGKSMETRFGIPAVYWRISMFQADHNSGNGSVVLEGFASELAARTKGLLPIAQHQIQYIENEFSIDDTRADIYQKLKTKTPWSGATDI